MSDNTLEAKRDEKLEEFIGSLKEKADALEKKIFERPYTLRPLCDEDLYPVLEIVSKVFPDDLHDAFVYVASGQKSIKEVGYDVAYRLVAAVIKNLHKVGDEVYAFLSDVSGIPAEKIRKMPFGTSPRMIWDIFREAKNADFFQEFSELS